MLTQLSTVKTRLQLIDGVYDDILTAAIAAFSERFDRECNRKFARQENATYEFRANARSILLPHYPIEYVTSFAVKSNENQGWINLGAEADFIDWLNAGVVTFVEKLGSCHQLARVTYTGGYVLPGTTPTAGQTALPADIEQACIDQVAYWFLNRTTPGLISVTVTNGAHVPTVDLLPSVANVLQKYQRMTL
jgi:hypothetical protein